MQQRWEWEGRTGQAANEDVALVQTCMMGAQAGAGGRWVGIVGSEERPKDVFRVGHKAVGSEAGSWV